jgi:hypothetical protein
MKQLPKLPPRTNQYVFSRPHNAHPALPVHLEFVTRKYKHYEDSNGNPTERVREIENRHWLGSFSTIELALGARNQHHEGRLADEWFSNEVKTLPDHHA